MKKLYMFFMLSFSIFLFTGCAGIKPEIMQNHYSVIETDENIKNPPIVFFFQGSGGNNRRAYDWGNWFSKHGIKSILIDNAGARGMNRLFGVNYGSDLYPILQALKKNPDIKVKNYALMGFSRGGTAALQAQSYLKDEDPKADFVFALYPGDTKGCPNTHGANTDVRVFYGDIDDWGNYKGIRSRCKSMAAWNENASFHLLKDAHHAYDGNNDGKFVCCGNRSFRYKGNAKAKEETQRIILEAMKKKWNIIE